MKAALIFSVFVFAVTCGFAQDSLQVTSEAKSTAIVMRLSRELKLSVTQQQAVYDIMMRRWVSLNALDAQGKQVMRQSVLDTTVDELRDVLTPDQFSEFMLLRKKANQDKANFRSRNPRYQFSATDLDLEL